MRSIRNNPLRRAPHFVELRHQAVLGMQTPGGINDEHVIAPRLRSLQCIEERSRRIAALPRLDDLNAAPLPPDLKLLNGSRAEGIRSAHQHAFALRAEIGSQLAGCRRLPGTAHPNHDDDFRGSSNRTRRTLLLIENILDLLFQKIAKLCPITNLLALRALAQCI